jgi:hypothetical protein
MSHMVLYTVYYVHTSSINHFVKIASFLMQIKEFKSTKTTKICMSRYLKDYDMYQRMVMERERAERPKALKRAR